jgi:cytochrome P450
MMLKYGSMVFGAFGPLTEWYNDLMRDAEEVSAWINARCERSALAPGGIGQNIYAAADSGELTHDEAKLLVRSLLSAGVDTTIDSIGLALRGLADHPDQFALLKADPALGRAVFEEATRYDSSSQSLFRTTLREVEFAGQTINKHEKVFLLLGSAGRDPDKWEEPDRFDITRKISGQIGYGWGIHGCVAQMMARLEGEVFFRTIGEKVESIESTGPAELRVVPGLRGLAKMPIALTPRKP